MNQKKLKARENEIKQASRLIVVFIFVFFLANAQTLFAQPEKIELAQSGPENVQIQERQIVEINQTLKNALDENRRLLELNTRLEGEVKGLRDTQMSQESEQQEIQKENAELSKRMETIKNNNRKYASKLQSMENDIQGLQRAKTRYMEQASLLEEELVIHKSVMPKGVMLLASVTDEEVKERESQTLDLLSKIDAFTEKDDRLRMDAAKAHYNMGNIYYQKGEYELAAREYYQSVTLMPDDPDAHYNLAYVSIENLKDYETGIKHFNLYLYLNPDAKDSYVVKEKIVHAQLKLRNVIDSPIDGKYDD